MTNKTRDKRNNKSKMIKESFFLGMLWTTDEKRNRETVRFAVGGELRIAFTEFC